MVRDLALLERLNQISGYVLGEYRLSTLFCFVLFGGGFHVDII